MIDPESKRVTVNGGTAPGEIHQLTVEFVRPGEGRFGHDKNVAYREATHGAVEYWKDNAHVQETVLLSSALAVIEQAERDAEAHRSRAADAAAREAEIVAHVKERLEHLSCPICGTDTFDQQTSREEGNWGDSSFKMRLLICRRCGFVLHFSQGRSFWMNPR
jgi:uncharacterized protein